MSDLHCPVTLLVVRHAHARAQPGDGAGVGPRLTDRGRVQATVLADQLSGRRVAAVMTSPLTRAVETGAVVADRLTVRATVVPELREFDLGELAGAALDDPRLEAVLDSWTAEDLDVRPPGGEAGQTVVDRFRRAADQLADRFRGETVLVVSHSGILALGLPSLTGAAPWPWHPAIPHCVPFELIGDADGWRLAT